MKRWKRRLLALLAIGTALLAVVVVTGVLVARSDWFRHQVRKRIIAEVERSTGGRADIASFAFDWRTLEARADGFTLRGTEPEEEAALFRAESVIVTLHSLLTSIDNPSVS